jgi:hypothetical protein
VYSKFYKPAAVDEVMLFRGRVIFKQYISKKQNHFDIKIYKLCNTTDYINMNVYLGKERQNPTQTMTATHVTVRSLTRGVEEVGHELYVDNLFSSLDIFNDLYKRSINCCGTVRQDHKGMPRGFDKKALKFKQDDIHATVRGKLMTMV